MSNILREYVKTLSIDMLAHISNNYDDFEKTGVIGNTALRRHAENVMKLYNMPSHNVTLMMRDLTFEVYREIISTIQKEYKNGTFRENIK